MKALFKVCTILLLISVMCSLPKRTQAQYASVSFQVFYDDLSPYGTWVDYPGYGYVWVPDAGDDFAPYATDGHWVYTDYGWMWVSDYPWGWAPFHYGRWIYDSVYGWIWVPGEEWGPAWVTWRVCDGFYGWVPMGYGYISADWWCFVSYRYFTDPHVYRYYSPRRENSNYISRSTVINRTYVDNSSHTTYVSGPRKEDVEKNSGTTVRPMTVSASSRPGMSVSGSSVNVYRPTMHRSGSSGARPAPSKVANLTDLPHRSAPATNTNTKSNRPFIGGSYRGPEKQTQQPAKQTQSRPNTNRPAQQRQSQPRPNGHEAGQAQPQQTRPQQQPRPQPQPQQQHFNTPAPQRGGGGMRGAVHTGKR